MAGIFTNLEVATLSRRGIARTVDIMRAGVQALTPGWLTRALARDPTDLVIAVDADGHGTLVTEGAAYAHGNDLAAALRKLSGPGAVLTIMVPPERAFVRALTVPAAALPRLDEVLALDLERATPFTRDQVLTAHRRVASDDGSANVEQVVIKASLLAPLMDAAQMANVPVKAVRIATGPYCGLNLLPPSLRHRSAVTRVMQLLTRSTLVVGLVLTIAGVIFQTWRLNTAGAAADLEQQQLTAALSVLRRESEDADRALQSARYARARRIERPMIVAILDDLSRRLPGTTWLTDVRLDETMILIEGHSANAAELVSLLSRSPGIDNVVFAAPITRDPQRGTERFQLRLTRTAAHGPAREASP